MWASSSVVEQLPLKQFVVGSSPTWPSIPVKNAKRRLSLYTQLMTQLEEAHIRNQQLQEEAKAIIRHFKLKELLAPLGEVHLWGSALYGLMVKPDIDFMIFNENLAIEPIIQIAENLMHTPQIGKVAVANHLIWPQKPGLPRSMYLSIKPIWNEQLWEIDIHIMNRKDQLDTQTFPIDWHTKLTSQQRDVIIMLKDQLVETKQYGKEFFSADIYRAVMNDGISSLTELENWRKTHPYQ